MEKYKVEETKDGLNIKKIKPKTICVHHLNEMTMIYDVNGKATNFDGYIISAENCINCEIEKSDDGIPVSRFKEYEII